MKIVYLSAETNFAGLCLDTTQTKNQNKYGTMYTFKDKLELVTSEKISEYHVFTSSENKDKMFLCVKSPQLNSALQAICKKLTEDHGHCFKPEKDVFYLKVTKEQADMVPRNQQLNVSINVYGVFHQTSTKTSFLQMELTGFKSYPLVQFA